MSTLLLVWIVSALTIFCIALYARIHASRLPAISSYGDMHFSDLVIREVVTLQRDLSRFLEAVKPHGRRTIAAGLVIAKRGQDIFISRVYGRIQSEKGRASSFFLKQIAEHKEKDAGREDGAHFM